MRSERRRSQGARREERLTAPCVLDFGEPSTTCSSAALRVVLAAHQRLAGGVLLAALHPVLPRRAGDHRDGGNSLPVFNSVAAAAEHCGAELRERAALASWDRLETRALPCGTFRFLPGSDAPGGIEVLGHIEDVLYARVAPAQVCDSRFSETEYSIGLGGFGDRRRRLLFPLMGEMITIGGHGLAPDGRQRHPRLPDPEGTTAAP